MPSISSDVLAALTTNFRALWEDQFLAAKNVGRLRSLIAMEAPSNTLVEDYSWLGTVPAMREWLAERQVEGLNDGNYSITNRDWESTIEVDRNWILDDRIGLVRPRISQLALEAVRHQEKLCIDTLEAGAATVCYDGQFFFDTDHAEGDSGTQSNDLTGTGTTLAQITTDYEAARTAMMGFKDDRGRVMNIMPTHVLCPVQLEGRFRELLTSQYVPSGNGTVDNPWKGTADLLVDARLSDANNWYLLALDQPVKPLIFQNRQEPEFTAMDDPKSPDAFRRRKYLYGVDARYAAGYGFWQLAVLTTN